MKPLLVQDNLNKTERAYADYLFRLKLAGEIVDYKAHPVKFILVESIPKARNAVTYEPDFLEVHKEYMEFIEIKAKAKPKLVVKGDKIKTKTWTSMRDDARVKVNMASELFPWFKWSVVYVLPGGEFEKERIN